MAEKSEKMLTRWGPDFGNWGFPTMKKDTLGNWVSYAVVAKLFRAHRKEVDALKADKAGLQEQVGKLLSMLDDVDAAVVADTGGLSMHTYGQTPDWFVEAAFWSCYGHAPNDPRAALNSEAAQ